MLQDSRGRLSLQFYVRPTVAVTFADKGAHGTNPWGGGHLSPRRNIKLNESAAASHRPTILRPFRGSRHPRGIGNEYGKQTPRLAAGPSPLARRSKSPPREHFAPPAGFFNFRGRVSPGRTCRALGILGKVVTEGVFLLMLLHSKFTPPDPKSGVLLRAFRLQ